MDSGWHLRVGEWNMHHYEERLRCSCQQQWNTVAIADLVLLCHHHVWEEGVKLGDL